MTAAQFKDSLIVYLSTLPEIKRCTIEMEDYYLEIKELNSVSFKFNRRLLYLLTNEDLANSNEFKIQLFESSMKVPELLKLYDSLLYLYFEFRKPYSKFPRSTFNKLLAQEGLCCYTYTRNQAIY